MRNGKSRSNPAFLLIKTSAGSDLTVYTNGKYDTESRITDNSEIFWPELLYSAGLGCFFTKMLL